MASQELVELQQYLTFILAGEEYAIAIHKIKEIIEYHTVTTVPKTPQWVRGVINLRGAVVPVVDLAVKIGMDQRPVIRTTCIIIIETSVDDQNATIGVIADAVSQVIELSADEIHDPPSFGTRVRVEYLLGMAPLANKFALVLDVDKVLSSEELIGLNQARESISQEEQAIAPDAALKAMQAESSGDREQRDAV